MEKIVILRDLAVSLLAFTSKDKYRKAMNGICCSADGSLVATDGKRMIIISQGKHQAQLAPGAYFIISKGIEAKGLYFLCLEKTEENFPDYTQVLPRHDLAIKENEKPLCFALLKGRKADIDHLKCMRELYRVFHITGKAYDPLLLLDLPADEGFDLYTDGTSAGVLDCRGTGIRAIFCPFRTQD